MLNSLRFQVHTMRRVCLSIAIALLLSACGQKGPLFLPKDKEPVEMTEEGTPRPRHDAQ